MEQNHLTNQKKEWQDIWKRQGVFSTIIDAGRTIYNWFFRIYLRKYIHKDTRILELGCGTSSLTLSLAPELKEIVGIDNAESALERSQKDATKLGVTNCVFEYGDCLAVSHTDTFDIVWSQGLMEHFEDPVSVAVQHYKAVKPGGIALISVPYKYSYHTLWYKMTRPKFLRSLWPWTEQIFYDKAELLQIGRKITPKARTHFLQPFFLGIIILELPK